MPVVMMYFMSFVKAFSKFGRWADLALGLVVLGLGVFWNSPWVIAGGVFSILAFSFNLNGWVQRKSLSFAQARVAARRKR